MRCSGQLGPGPMRVSKATSTSRSGRGGSSAVVSDDRARTPPNESPINTFGPLLAIVLSRSPSRARIVSNDSLRAR